MQQISDGVLLSASGCLSDTLELKQVLKRNSKLYEWENGKIISVNAMSHLLAYVLYSRRTFPCKFYVVILMFIVIVIVIVILFVMLSTLVRILIKVMIESIYFISTHYTSFHPLFPNYFYFFFHIIILSFFLLFLLLLLLLFLPFFLHLALLHHHYYYFNTKILLLIQFFIFFCQITHFVLSPVLTKMVQLS